MHSRLLSKHFPEVRRAYSSRSPDQAADLVRDFGGEQCAGGWRSALQTPGIDAVFDVHVSRGAAAQDFLGRLEEKLAETIPIRPHWGKEFFMDHGELKERYPAESWRAFEAMKLKYDPNNLFSNAYTERVYGW